MLGKRQRLVASSRHLEPGDTDWKWLFSRVMLVRARRPGAHPVFKAIATASTTKISLDFPQMKSRLCRVTFDNPEKRMLLLFGSRRSTLRVTENSGVEYLLTSVLSDFPMLSKRQKSEGIASICGVF